MLHVCNSTTLCLGPATSIADEIATIFPRHDRSIHDVGRWRRPNTGGVVLHENATSDCADEDADATRSAQRPSHTLLREERDRADIRAGRGTESDAIHETGVHAVRQGERCKRSFFYYGQLHMASGPLSSSDVHRLFGRCFFLIPTKVLESLRGVQPHSLYAVDITDDDKQHWFAKYK